MTELISLGEYDYLLRGGSVHGNGEHSIPEKDWDWLIAGDFKHAIGIGTLFRPALRNRKQALQVLNYVGVLSLPSGLVIEILPKSVDTEQEITSRRWLLKMIASVNDLPFSHFDDSDLQVIKRPLLEILIGRFLQSVQHLLNQGLRSEYCRVETNEPFLKGKLRLTEHIRLLPHQRNNFPIEYDEYSLDRPENRLLNWSINQVYHWSNDTGHRTHARKLLTLLSPIPMSKNPIDDLENWRSDRLMQHYQPLRKWVELIVKKFCPISQHGNSAGLSLLFPMERLFEKYVCTVLRRHIPSQFDLLSQPLGGWLAKHMDENIFRLKPDMILRRNKKPIMILDTKWKNIDQANRSENYRISEQDMYQMYVYGQRCLEENHNIVLIYPMTKNFNKPLPPFRLGDRTLWAIPFDVEKDQFIGLEEVLIPQTITTFLPLGSEIHIGEMQ